MKKLSLCRFDFKNIPENKLNDFEFKKDDTFCFFGEIPNLKGHCVVVRRSDGRVFVGYHTENFKKIEREKV